MTIELPSSGMPARTRGNNAMAKGKNKAGREAKKPKADKKTAAQGTTFLRPMPVAAKPSSKPSAKPE